jgi:hypothetical protein
MVKGRKSEGITGSHKNLPGLLPEKKKIGLEDPESLSHRSGAISQLFGNK